METIQTTDLIPVDLNCLLLYLEIMLCTIYEQQDEEALQNILPQMLQRNKAIDRYCWNEEKGFYFDFQFKDRQQSNAYTLAATFPLFFNLSTPEQSGKVAFCIEEKFLKPGGLISTLTVTQEQWDAPNGWAPLQWISYKGLKKNGLTQLANRIRQNWMRNNEKVYAATGKMMEKYNVVDIETEAGGGEYPNQDGFGWTNGVYLKFMSEGNIE